MSGQSRQRVPAAVILAGGRGRRMGGSDKALIDLGGQTLLTRIVARLTPQADAIALNANGDPRRFAAYGLPVLADETTGHQGPLAGILAGLEWAAGEGLDQIMTVAADTPFFPPDLGQRLLGAVGAETPIALAASAETGEGERRHPTFGIWPVVLRQDLRQAIDEGTRRIVQWADRHQAASVLFAGESDPFFNINTPQDVEHAERRLRDNSR